MRWVLSFISFAVALFAAASLATPRSAAEEMVAFATIRNADGDSVGTARFTELTGGDVRLEVEVRGLAPGMHGMHIHSAGNCVGPDFTSAAAHFNPLAHNHGLQTSDGPHAGDLPNLVVGPDGRGQFRMTVGRFTLSPGKVSLLDTDGSALVIHAAVDDGYTDPTGNSGGRVACGVVMPGSATT